MSSKPAWRLQNLSVKVDERGSLIPLEAEDNVPFPIARVYYIYDTSPGVTRGHHAHKNLEQLLICTSGSCEIHVTDSMTEASFTLAKPDQALYVGANVWRDMRNFSSGCVLLVIASAHYNDADYIKNYDEFVNYMKAGMRGEDKLP